MKNILLILAGFAAGIIFTVFMLIKVFPSQMIVVKESNVGFNETVSAIEVNAEKNGWAVAKVWDMQKRMEKAGYDDVPRVKVMELCHAKHSYDILRIEDDRFISAIMPCRMAVWEKSNGKVMISRMNIGLLSKFFGSNIENVMAEVAAEDLMILNGVIIPE